mgnify:CR=1 FL=1
MSRPQLIKLHRSRQHRILAGVMGGIADAHPVRHYFLRQRGRAGHFNLHYLVVYHAQRHARFLPLASFR